MSARAAWRLESLGFGEVYDYEAGKLDWLAAGLPSEGELAGAPTAGQHARRDAPTCGIDERLGDVRDRVRADGWDVCVAVNDERVVFGLLRHDELEGDPDRRVEDAMRPGPSTFRPNVTVLELATLMVDHDMPGAPVTTSDGRLVGVLTREDAVRVVREAHLAHEHQEGSG